MKKINLKDVKNAISRDELRAIKGGSGPWCPGTWCGPSPIGSFQYYCSTPYGHLFAIYRNNSELCYIQQY
jgi:natural product precursor